MELCGSGINKEHQMCSKTFGYERIKDLSENVFRLKKISRWRLMWRKIMMGMKHKKKDQVLDHCFRYDPFTYSQNFENDGTIAYHEDPDSRAAKSLPSYKDLVLLYMIHIAKEIQVLMNK
ncbi:hypothetical protein YC2023_005793 [Brassica napus]